MKSAAERAKIIAERGRKLEHPERMWIRNDWDYRPVHEVPVEALVLNVDNRRFRAERMWAEEQLGRSLDPPNHPDDERSIESLLLDTSHTVDGGRIVGKESDDYEALQRDYLLRGQETPLWIRPDGTVRNGNRRLAMIKRTQRDLGDAGLQWVEAVILDNNDIDEPTLLEMEQREQLTANFKVRYSDIDYLLALREAAVLRDIDFDDRESIETVAGELHTMVEKSTGEVVRDLYAIKYMDHFLIDAGVEGHYHRVLRTLERFRDIGRMMMKVEEDYLLDAGDVLQVLFAAVRAGRPHGDIRAIRRMFRDDRERFDDLAQQIAGAEDGWEPQPDGLGTPAVAAEVPDEDDEDDEDDAPAPQVTNYPKTEVGSAITVAIDGFEASKQDDLIQIAREVLNRLEILDDRLTEPVDDPELRELIVSLIEWADGHRELLAR